VEEATLILGREEARWQTREQQGHCRDDHHVHDHRRGAFAEQTFLDAYVARAAASNTALNS
jgi:hypothetical protein